ncbi:hypothetical protein EC957_007548 [Mortierella hygrophila]|uniref:Uncharacterized protein n=1 Tax=Mortierella hygrophila TaxID=979708 RepID=A0A9P6EYC5_9FUNG|nr:hypothetical protein EC957_007548 [Mortierella hygrophila]
MTSAASVFLISFEPKRQYMSAENLETHMQHKYRPVSTRIHDEKLFQHCLTESRARRRRVQVLQSKAAKNISKAVYDRLRQILPRFRPANKDSICIGRLIVDAAAEFSVQLRNHFRDYPFTIGARMLECGWSKTDLPAGSFKEQPGSQTVGVIQQTTAEERKNDDDEKDKDDDEEDIEDEDECEGEGDNDTSMRFAGGYIRHW